MKRFVAIGWLLLMALGLEGQTNVEIAGEVVGGAGKRVVLGAYSDMLTQSEVVLDSATVGTDGRFTLRCYANYPRLVFLQMERYSQSFYIEPSRNYSVYVPQFDWDMDEKRNIFLEPVALPLEFLGLDSMELNLRIMRYEAVVDSFLDANRERLDFRFKPDRKVWKELEKVVVESGKWKTERDAMLADSGERQEDFFERYVKFNTAEMALAMRMESRKKLFYKYIADQPIRYHDENYMRFFLALMEHSVSEGTKKVAQWQMAELVARADLAAWLDTLGLAPLLQNEQVRELAALQALKEMFFIKGFSRKGVLETLRRLGEKTKFEEHRTLATALLGVLEHSVSRGQQVESFELPDIARNKVKLEDFRGKWVYLGFVRTGDPNSIKEIETMAHFRDTVYRTHPEVVFVTVVCDREFQKMYHFVKNSRRGARCNWTWLHFDGDYKMLEQWGVMSYPTFVLLDPEGRRVYDYTPWPASGILLNLGNRK